MHCSDRPCWSALSRLSHRIRLRAHQFRSQTSHKLLALMLRQNTTKILVLFGPPNCRTVDPSARLSRAFTNLGGASSRPCSPWLATPEFQSSHPELPPADHHLSENKTQPPHSGFLCRQGCSLVQTYAASSRHRALPEARYLFAYGVVSRSRPRRPQRKLTGS